MHVMYYYHVRIFSCIFFFHAFFCWDFEKTGKHNTGQLVLGCLDFVGTGPTLSSTLVQKDRSQIARGVVIIERLLLSK